MTAYIIRRLLMGILVVIIVSLVVFCLVRFLPGDPLLLYMSGNDLTNLSSEQMHQLKIYYGLDKSYPLQYVDWIKGVVTGDLGTSINDPTPVASLIKERLPVTIFIGLIAMTIGLILGIFFGVMCALKRGTWIDNVLTTLANVGICLPGFWVAIMLIYLFSVQLHWLPMYGFTSPLQDFWLSMRQLIMPVFCLSLGGIAGITRQARSSTLEVTRQDYIRTAWAKGLSERNIVLKHIIKNSLIPIITMIGMQVHHLFAGAVILETVFNIPGIGRLLTTSIFARDYQIVQAGALITSVAVVFSNLTVDIVYSYIDPRIRYS